MQALSPAPISAPISLVEKTPGMLELLLRDVPKETISWKPASDRWSIEEVLAHLVMIEQLYNGRTRRIAMENDPVLPKHVQPPGSEKQKTAREYLDEFVALRRAFVVFLHSIPSTAAGRTGQHAELGTITLSQLLHELANHDLGHLRQIAELYRAHSFHPYAGPFQKYSLPKP
jgi:uncharacterized damage-inducible protein DinB